MSRPCAVTLRDATIGSIDRRYHREPLTSDLIAAACRRSVAREPAQRLRLQELEMRDRRIELLEPPLAVLDLPVEQILVMTVQRLALQSRYSSSPLPKVTAARASTSSNPAVQA